MHRFALVLSLLLGFNRASAGVLDTKNPDVPEGGAAIDLTANMSAVGSFEESTWHLVDVVSTGSGLLADGLTVESEADLRATDLGVSLMTALTPRVTAQVHYRYSELLIDNVRYIGAGALEPPDLRTNPPYETRMVNHQVGVRLRFWFGTD
jgi:hypothetical protein